jgi:hypothetical protein
MLVSWFIEWSKSGIPHAATFTNFAHQAWAIWHSANHDLYLIIPHPGSHKRGLLSLESICTISFEPRASDVKLAKLRWHSCTGRIPFFFNVFGTFPWSWDHANVNPGLLFRCLADIFLNITHGEIQWPGILITWNIGQVSLVGCTNDWHNCHSGRILTLCIPPLVLATVPMC